MTKIIDWFFASRRHVGLVVFAVIVGLLSESLFLQHVEGFEPCPMCVIQRYEFVLLALLALVAALIPGVLGRIVHASAILIALAGMGTAAWHVKLQLFPPVSETCGPGLEYMIGELPLTRALPMIFHGSGDCSEVQWTFLGISIAGWSLVWFTLFTITLITAWRRSSR
jgi:disulfide bond formation protein DsbB